MLIITRRVNESFTIEPSPGLHPDMTLKEVFAQGGIEVRVLHSGRSRVRLAVQAPSQLEIWRSAIVVDTEDEP